MWDDRYRNGPKPNRVLARADDAVTRSDATGLSRVQEQEQERERVLPVRVLLYGARLFGGRRC